MPNLRLKIEYDGTGYCGWQVQGRNNDKKSIQEVLEKSLRKIMQEKVNLCVSGRTDAGVHALAQVVNFHTSRKMPLDRLKMSLNSILPKDIAIISVEEAPPDFHSRFDAKSKIYRYTILNRPYPCVSLRNRAYFYHRPLDIVSMRREAKDLLGRHDFKAFSSSASKAKNTTRTIKNILIRKTPYPDRKNCLITIDIEANGFLYNMARRIAGTLIEVGKGKFLLKSALKILHSQNRKLSPAAYACGLTLIKVKY